MPVRCKFRYAQKTQREGWGAQPVYYSFEFMLVSASTWPLRRWPMRGAITSKQPPAEA